MARVVAVLELQMKKEKCRYVGRKVKTCKPAASDTLKA